RGRTPPPRPARVATASPGGCPPPPRGRTVAVPVGPGFDGPPVPLVGRVSMDLTTCDVTDHPGLAPGDWLEVMGPRCTPDEVAEAAGTNAYEVLTGLGSRIARI